MKYWSGSKLKTGGKIPFKKQRRNTKQEKEVFNYRFFVYGKGLVIDFVEHLRSFNI